MNINELTKKVNDELLLLRVRGLFECYHASASRLLDFCLPEDLDISIDYGKFVKSIVVRYYPKEYRMTLYFDLGFNISYKTIRPILPLDAVRIINKIYKDGYLDLETTDFENDVTKNHGTDNGFSYLDFPYKDEKMVNDKLLVEVFFN